MKKIVEALSLYQKTNKLSQSQMAEELGVCQSSYNGWINERHGIGSKHLLKISTLCGIAFEEFLEELIPKGATIHIQPAGQSAISESIDALELYKEVVQTHKLLNQSLQDRIVFLEGELGRFFKK